MQGTQNVSCFVDYTISLDVLLTAFLVIPLCYHLFRVLKQKNIEISSTLSLNAKKLYLQYFFDVDNKNNDICKSFNKMYWKRYGNKLYIFPSILIILIAFIENYYSAVEFSDIINNKSSITTTFAAISGAYAFVTWGIVTRAFAGNLCVIDIMQGALRLMVAIPLGYAVSMFSKEYGVFFAFAIGVFPLDTVSTFCRQLSNKNLGTEIGAGEAFSQVINLSGVDATCAEKIQNANITTIAQLAWCDPIQLCMKTKYDFDFILDLCSQALAWVYFEKNLEKLRPLGLRGAVEITRLLNELDIEEYRENAEAVILAAATATGIDIAGLQYAFKMIKEDPYSEFLCEVWLPLDKRVAQSTR
jgi:hypothetical protein